MRRLIGFGIFIAIAAGIIFGALIFQVGKSSRGKPVFVTPTVSTTRR